MVLKQNQNPQPIIDRFIGQEEEAGAALLQLTQWSISEAMLMIMTCGDRWVIAVGHMMMFCLFLKKQNLSMEKVIRIFTDSMALCMSKSQKGPTTNY